MFLLSNRLVRRTEESGSSNQIKLMMRKDGAESEQLKHTPDQLQQERKCVIYVFMYLGQVNHFTASGI